jgi:hypothetical protein
MSKTLKVWSFNARGLDGCDYSVRLLATDAELEGWQRGSLVPSRHITQVIGMQPAADALIARIEYDSHTASGGKIQ